MHNLQFYHLGTMLLAFTVFYAYIHFTVLPNLECNVPRKLFGMSLENRVLGLM